MTPEAREYVPILLADPCSYCGADTSHIDHIHPVARGGDSDWLNLTGACRACNYSKTDSPLWLFLLRQTRTPARP